MFSDPREYLRRILVEAEYLVARTAGLKFEDFVVDETLRRAVVRSLEIIGEAAKKGPADFRARYRDVEWRAMAGLRDRLIHGYFGVDYEIVWDILQNRIAALRAEIASILDES
jgi:uncharacterized protein with HEPN domain